MTVRVQAPWLQFMDLGFSLIGTDHNLKSPEQDPEFIMNTT